LNENKIKRIINPKIFIETSINTIFTFFILIKNKIIFIFIIIIIIIKLNKFYNFIVTNFYLLWLSLTKQSNEKYQIKQMIT